MTRIWSTMMLAALALVACGGVNTKAYCDVIKSAVAESPNKELSPSRQVQVLRQLEHVAPDVLRRDLAVYRSQAKLIATDPTQVRSFPAAVSSAFDHLSTDAKRRCGTDPFSPASPDAPNSALTLTVPLP